GMYRLRSIDPLSGFARDFDLEEDGPVLIGRLSADGVREHLKSLINDVPSEQKDVISEDIENVRYTITMKECKIEPRTVSRVHCMIFPGGQARIVDLFSTNGTVIARKDAGISLNPGELTDLFPGDLILLSRGRALFHYIGTIPFSDASAHPPG
ncbi:MAG: FHA domain-containing protein, partial [Deltaproteobacteria bacterium]|nr:FHA domain-containing protein [Deltaproteobacteria bacterium]